MKYIRKNVWGFNNEWDDTILWYARGVEAMKKKPISDSTSWNFFGAIHGINKQLWQMYGYFDPSAPLPPAADVSRYWDQCQHGSWYFLPWHRGYLLALEANVRAEIQKLGGPDDWALPYWNYFKNGQNGLPKEFASKDWPDGQGNNPLFVEQRYGPNNDGNVFVPINRVNMNALKDPDFTGVPSGGSPGFGGVDTGFSHGGSPHGALESQPHDMVHVYVGGSNPTRTNLPGLMSYPPTAGLDPIFFLHHGNIDRLWESWRQTPAHVDPTEANWLNGPANTGERKFSMPMPGGVPWDYVPSEMSDLSSLNYVYESLEPKGTVAMASLRMDRLVANMPAASEPVARSGAAPMAAGKNVEMIGANKDALTLSGSDIRSTVSLDNSMRNKVSRSLSDAPQSGAEPDRVFLNLENVRGQIDSTILHVYVAVPDGADPEDHPDRNVGSVALFGVSKASDADEEHAGSGLTYVLEMTDVIDSLHLENGFDLDDLEIRIVPENPINEDAQITVGRISIHRQGH